LSTIVRRDACTRAFFAELHEVIIAAVLVFFVALLLATRAVSRKGTATNILFAPPTFTFSSSREELLDALELREAPRHQVPEARHEEERAEGHHDRRAWWKPRVPHS
jgi:hypothetical protein